MFSSTMPLPRATARQQQLATATSHRLPEAPWRLQQPSAGPRALKAVIALAAAALLLCTLLLPRPALADAGRWLNTPSYAELSAELAALQGPPGGPAPTLNSDQQRRLADLTVLEQAIAASDDRSQVINGSRHNLGLFSLSKKAAPGTEPSFGVLAPGHESDDDVSVVALYLPSGVNLQWGEQGRVTATVANRVVSLPEGAQLTVAEPSPASEASASSTAAPEAVTYTLSLPAFSVKTALADLAELPALGQAELDALPESAPVD